MPFITLLEILYLVILTFVIGYIFSGYIKKPITETDLVYDKSFSWDDIKYATLITAPGVILHELGHKFVAIFFGLDAVLHIFWEGLGLALFLKLISSPFLIIAPAYVSISSNGSPLISALTSFAGPFVNLLLFLIAYIILDRAKLTKNQATILYLTKQINLFLFIFNMIPIPPLDGYNFFYSLYRFIF